MKRATRTKYEVGDELAERTSRQLARSYARGISTTCDDRSVLSMTVEGRFRWGLRRRAQVGGPFRAAAVIQGPEIFPVVLRECPSNVLKIEVQMCGMLFDC